MKIAVIPTVREIHKNQFEYSVDKRIFTFFNKVLKKNCSFNILNGLNNLKDENILILVGGNTITKLSNKKNDLIRSKLDKKYFTQAKKKSIKILGICHGAQFIANCYKAEFKSSNKHVNTIHKVKILKKNYNVNSFHKYIIIRCSKNILRLGFSKENAIEYFKVKNKKIYGIMWHPERNDKISKIDIQLVRKLCN